MKNSTMFTLNLNDVARGAIVAVLAGVFLPLLAVLQTPDFSIVAVNWNQVLVLAINGGLTGLAAYLSKNLLSTENGKVFGKI